MIIYFLSNIPADVNFWVVLPAALNSLPFPISELFHWTRFTAKSLQRLATRLIYYYVNKWLQYRCTAAIIFTVVYMKRQDVYGKIKYKTVANIISPHSIFSRFTIYMYSLSYDTESSLAHFYLILPCCCCSFKQN